MEASNGSHYQDVLVPAGGVDLPAHLRIPQYAEGMIVFVHGSGSSRHSPRNRYISDRLVEGGYGTLLFDLLTEDEDRGYAERLDIERMAARLLSVIRWTIEYGPTKGLRIGLFGS